MYNYDHLYRIDNRKELYDELNNMSVVEVRAVTVDALFSQNDQAGWVYTEAIDNLYSRMESDDFKDFINSL